MKVNKLNTLSICAILFISLNLMSQIPKNKIGVVDSFSDIGSPYIPGEAVSTHTIQKYNIKASVFDIWFDTNSFSFLLKKMQGDFIIRSKIKLLGEGHEPYRKTGVKIRSSNDSNSVR